MSRGNQSNIFINSDRSVSVAPDVPYSIFSPPTPDFVLCRDSNGKPTAIYGRDIWDFNPYRLSARKISVINFNTLLPKGVVSNSDYVAEVKYIMYCIIYTSGSGRLGRLSVSTLVQYFQELRNIARFCFELRSKPLVGMITIQQLLETPVYFSALVLKYKDSRRFTSRVSGLLAYLANVGEERLGYKVVQADSFDLSRPPTEQHPVIPTRIYLNIINDLGVLLDRLDPVSAELEKFIACFADDYYGRANLKQKQMGVGGRKYHRPTFSEALELHRLSDVLIGDFYCSSRKNLSVSLSSIQYVIKTIIHLYTGMRDQEVLRLNYDCIIEELITPRSVDSGGVIRDPAKMVSILSTTTKFEGYRREESWLATDEVVRAVKVAQAICRGLAVIYKLDPHDCPLLLNPSILLNDNAEVGVGTYNKGLLDWRQSLLIQASDLLELSETDPGRDFYRNPKFAVGRPWNLTSHQFRRSLAFYASSSGFVSLPTLRSQYKHMTLQMTRYYSNNFERLKTIFGYYNPEKNRFELPQSHVALEFQMGIPMSVANQLLADLLEGAALFGGTGSYIQKQKALVGDGDIWIEDVRAETIIRVQKGEIFYRPTFVGGCSKVGRCDEYLLGDFTTCLGCESGIIHPEKVDNAISETGAELLLYAEGSGEYQVIKGDLERLKRFRARFISQSSEVL